MRIAITGPEGFLAWHVRCALRSRQDNDIVGIGRTQFGDSDLMDVALSQADVVIHLAGVNRAPDQESIASDNIMLAERLAEGLTRSKRPIPVVFGNSIHQEDESPFGRGKREASGILRRHADVSGSPFADVLLPNIFGEHGRPYYNSVVATFSHQLAIGEMPKVEVDRELPLLHAQRAASVLLECAFSGVDGRVSPSGTPTTVSAVLDQLRAIAGPYADGQLPDLADPFTRDLFNTYRSFTFPDRWPIHPIKHADERGELVEAVRAGGGETQVFFSTTRPDYSRGGHFHLNKVERFLVLKGQASIRLRKLFTDEVVEFTVSGDEPAIVDMPTLWTHEITNTGDSDLLTLFYADDQFDPENPDTYWVAV
jgi:UDP-2-acetamido-2,6-beta-L-arabino-hexul-4-ose reductase